jgi:hypothetical protein
MTEGNDIEGLRRACVELQERVGELETELHIIRIAVRIHEQQRTAILGLPMLHDRIIDAQMRIDRSIVPATRARHQAIKDQAQKQLDEHVNVLRMNSTCKICGRDVHPDALIPKPDEPAEAAKPVIKRYPGNTVFGSTSPASPPRENGIF